MQPKNSKQIRGWLLDVYPSDFGKVTVWIISENGERIKLTDTFQPCIYVSGKQEDLEGLISKLCNNQKIASWRFIQKYVQVTDNEKSRVLELTVKDTRQIRSLTLEILRLGDYLRMNFTTATFKVTAHTSSAMIFSHLPSLKSKHAEQV